MSDTSISFFIPGIPKPGGSKRAFVLRRRDGSIVTRPNGSPIVNVTDDAGQKNADWKANCKFFAGQAYDGPPLRGPLAITVMFVMPRLVGHYGTGKNAGVLKPNAPLHHTVKPDATKLMRSTEDALTGLLWCDDAQLAKQSIEKVYGEKPGAHVTIEVLSTDSPQPRGANVAPLFQCTSV